MYVTCEDLCLEVILSNLKPDSFHHFGLNQWFIKMSDKERYYSKGQFLSDRIFLSVLDSLGHIPLPSVVTDECVALACFSATAC